MQFDYTYLCQGIGHLTGLETRVFKGDMLHDRYSPCPFDPDLASLVQPQLQACDDSAFYLETKELLVFGVVRSKRDQTTLILGPSSQIKPDRQALHAILLSLSEPYSRLSELQSYFDNMVSYPFENFLEIISFINYAINQEKVSAATLVAQNPTRHARLRQEHQGSVRSLSSIVPDSLADAAHGVLVDAAPRTLPVSSTRSGSETETPHNTYEAEKVMLSHVSTGNVAAIQAFMDNPPTGRIGTLAHQELRQRKNALIIAVTLTCRAAIDGGLPTQTAFALSDRYIQTAEQLDSSSEITVQTMEMLLDFTKRVESLKCGAEDSRLARNLMRLVYQNISTRLTTTDLARALGMNRTYLCERFRQETGRSISDMILSIKIDEAKRLMATTNLSLAQISESLAFSSQSYFHALFKKVTGSTPKAYRQNWESRISPGLDRQS